MERLSLDEVIAHCNRYTERMESHSGRMQLEETPIGNSDIMKQYWEHRQVAEWLEQLKAYKDAEEQGLLLRLPCKIGDDVYFIPSEVNYKLNILNGYEKNNRVYHQKIERIVLTRNGWYVECDKDIEYGTDRIHIKQHFGETWFLTREEAEAALEKMKGEDHE